MNDVHIHFHLRAEHADRILDAVLTVHVEVLADDVDHVILRRQIDGLGVLDHVLHVLVGDFAVGGHDRMHAPVVETAQVPAAHPEVYAANFHVRHLLGFDDGVPNVLAGEGSIDNLRFAHAARTRLADPDDAESGRVGIDFAHHGTNFRGADLQADDDRRWGKHVFFCWVRINWVWARRADPRWLRPRARANCWPRTGRASGWPCHFSGHNRKLPANCAT